MENYKKEFIDTLNKIDKGKSPHEVLYDFLQMAKITLANVFYGSNELTDEYFRYLNRYTRGDKEKKREYEKKFAPLLGITQLALLENPEQDFLGEIYMDIACIKGNNKGQFFTPYVLAKCNAGIILDNPKKQIEEEGYITISEPACGSGVMAIAARNALVNAEAFNRNACVMLCADIDKNCCAMTYIQLSLLDVPALVVHGDSLKCESWEQLWTTPYFFSKFAWMEDPFKKPEPKPKKKGFGKKLPKPTKPTKKKLVFID